MFRQVATAVVAVVLFGFSGFAGSARAANYELSLKHTGWISETTNSEGKTMGLGLVFRGDGKFAMFTEVDGQVDKIEGTYTIEQNVVKIRINGQNREIDIVSLEGDTLVTSGGNKGEVRWVKLKQ